MFSKKQEPTSARAIRMPSNSDSTFSVIGPDITITGDIEASADLHIDGSVTGDIGCSSLVQGEKSRIEGEIRAKKARLAGQVHGRIDAVDLVILKSAKINGDVSYDTLTIEQGASVNGTFCPHGVEPSAAIEDAEFEEQSDKRIDDTDAGKTGNLSLAG